MTLTVKFKSNRFLILGRAGMDLYADPPGAKTEQATQFFACLGGSSANIAVALARQDAGASLVTCVSDDAVGRFIVNQLRHYGIDTEHVRKAGGQARSSLALVETRVEDHQSVIYRNGAADFEMTVEDVSGLPYQDFGALIVTGTALAAEPSRTAAFKAFELAKAAGLPIVFDIDYRPYSWPSAAVAAEVYERAGKLCDVVVGNDDEFGFMAGGKAKGLEMARGLADTSARVAVYKLGERGSITMTRDTSFTTGIFPVTALKPTGAGDAFLGNFIASLAKGHPLQASVLRGSAAAAMVVANVGCAPAMPSTADLEAFMRNHDSNRSNDAHSTL